MTTFDLDGLSGENPLAFMAALGTLVVADRAWPGGQVQLAWSDRGGAWRPRLTVPGEVSREELLKNLYVGVHREPKADSKEGLRTLDKAVAAAKKNFKDANEIFKNRLKAKVFKKGSPEAEVFVEAEVAPLMATLSAAEQARAAAARAGATPDLTTALGPNLKVPAPELAKLARQAALLATPTDRRDPDFFAAFGCEAIADKDGILSPTRFSKQNGNSNKNMLSDIALLMQRVSPHQIEESLFETWRYQDDKYSLGWDPRDVRPYAYQAENPDAGSVTMHGANLLAYEALTLFPAVPRGHRLVTTGTVKFEDGEVFTWPVWESPLPVAVVRSLVAHSALTVLAPDRRLLGAVGVVEVYRAEHVTVGKSQRFRVARPA
jgi:hypothetical protein